MAPNPETDGAFQWFDYAVFGVFLCISLSVGLYHWLKSRKLRKMVATNSMATTEFLMGGRQMPVVPIALSLLTTFLSGVTMLGTPAEVYRRGLLFWVYYLSGGVSILISGVFFLPIFYRLQPISIYEYFEKRFDSLALRKLTAFMFLFNTCFYMSVVLYSPAVALAAVTGLPLWPWVLIIGVVCMIYTSIGGLKAVVWTDTIQAFFMYLGVGTMIIKGVLDAGGLTQVWDIGVMTGRMEELSNVSLNPLQYQSLWTAFFGGIGLWLSLYGVNQMALQRYCSLPSLRDARMVVAITVPAFWILGSMACFIGLVCLAYFFQECDPLLRETNRITPDQLIVLFAVRTLKLIPGLPGLFLATMFSSTLSTFSSGMNSQSAVMWEDFLKPHLGHRINDDQAATFTKFLVLVFGAIATGLAFLAPLIGGIIKASFNIIGGLGGPLVGIFFLGVFIPQANAKGTLIGLICAALINLVLTVGGIFEAPYAKYSLPANTTACPNYDAAEFGWDDKYGNDDVIFPFRISSYLLPLLGIFLVMIFGTGLSYAFPEKDLSEDTKARRRALTFWAKKSDYDVAEKFAGLEMANRNAASQKVGDSGRAEDGKGGFY